MRKSRFPGLCVAVVLVLAIAAGLSAFEPMSGYAPETVYDPTIWDGAATDWNEWGWAARFPNWFNDGTYPNAGFFYDHHKHGWQATSSSANTAFYPGVAYFLAHDIEGEPAPSPFEMFRQRNDNDWNVAEFTAQDINVKCWIFGGDDAENDTAWIKLSDGLQDSDLIPEGPGTNLINDAEASFIVRVYDDPTTDVHWFPGLPEPGDPDWDWADWYGVFGSYGFNNSFYTTGLDTRPGYEGDNEVYEWVFYWGHPDEDTVWLPGGRSAPPLLDSSDILVVIIDPPKDTLVFFAPNLWIHVSALVIGWDAYAVDCMPSQNIIADYGETVGVNFYIRNIGSHPDSYSATMSDTKGWDLDPSDFDIDLDDMGEWQIAFTSVQVPPKGFQKAEDIVDTVIMTLQSVGDPDLIKAGSLTVTIPAVGVEELDLLFPTEFKLSHSLPNPFTRTVSISYQLPVESEVSLVIYDAAGRVVRTLVDEKKSAGYHAASWNGRSDADLEVPAGVYFCKFQAGAYEAIEKVILVR